MKYLGLENGEHVLIEWSGSFKELIESNMYPDCIWYDKLRKQSEVDIFLEIIRKVNKDKIGEIWY
jgi:hypothetical protein